MQSFWWCRCDDDNHMLKPLRCSSSWWNQQRQGSSMCRQQHIGELQRACSVYSMITKKAIRPCCWCCHPCSWCCWFVGDVAQVLMAPVIGRGQENTVLNLLFMFEICLVYCVSRLNSNFTTITFTDFLCMQDRNPSWWAWPMLRWPASGFWIICQGRPISKRFNGMLLPICVNIQIALKQFTILPAWVATANMLPTWRGSFGLWGSTGRISQLCPEFTGSKQRCASKQYILKSKT